MWFKSMWAFFACLRLFVESAFFSPLTAQLTTRLTALNIFKTTHNSIFDGWIDWDRCAQTPHWIARHSSAFFEQQHKPCKPLTPNVQRPVNGQSSMFLNAAIQVYSRPPKAPPTGDRGIRGYLVSHAGTSRRLFQSSTRISHGVNP